MSLFQSPQHKVESILKNLDKSKTRENDLSSLIQILNNEPSMMPGVLKSLATTMAKDDLRSFISASHVLNRLADEYPDDVSGSLEMIMEHLRTRKKVLNEYEWMPVLEFFTKIHNEHPENMGFTLPALFSALGNSNPAIRATAYSLLQAVAVLNPEFFKDYSKEIIKVLNGLNLDERLYACKIIGIIAEKNPEIVLMTYDLVEDLFLNHPDTNLRSEAGLAADKLRPKTKVARQTENHIPLIKQEVIKPKLSNVTDNISMKNPDNVIKDKGQIATALQTMIPERGIISATLVSTDGRMISHSGPQIDMTLLIKLSSIMPLDVDDNFHNRISIEQSDKKIVAVRVGKKAILVVVTGAETSIGMLHLMLNKSVEKLHGMLMDSGLS
ncbi:Uncharacterised protein [uncultured archaeon]|nr:Uncharacterised protein [uncultured archaeon]